MTTLIAGLIVVYVLGLVLWTVFGIVVFMDEQDGDSARFLLAAPVWPAALLIFTARVFVKAARIAREEHL